MKERLTKPCGDIFCNRDEEEYDRLMGVARRRTEMRTIVADKQERDEN